MADTLSKDTLKRRDDACAALIATLQAEAAEAGNTDTGKDIDAFVTDVFGKYFAASQQKKEPPEVAAGKISKIVAKQARGKIVPKPAAPPPAPPPAATAEAPAQQAPAAAVGSVTGKTAGIERKIMNVLTEVSAFFETPIAILSGQRNQSQQANAMYTNWQSHLRSGKDNAWLAKNEKLRLQLDDRKQEKDKAGFISLLTKKADWSALSRHLSGDEVDLAASTDPNIVAALATCLNHRTGRNSEGARVHHFDNSRVVWPITESTRAKWQK